MKKHFITILSLLVCFSAQGNETGGLEDIQVREIKTTRTAEVQHLVCAGDRDTPIDFDEQKLSPASEIKVNYKPTKLVLLDNRYTLNILNQNKKSCVLYQKTKYYLKNIHFHVPSEHTYKSNTYPMEIHFIHQDKKSNTLVLGSWIKSGKRNNLIKKIFNQIPPDFEEKQTTISFNPVSLLPKNKRFFAYTSNYTLPPCQEGLKWVIFKQPITASQESIDFFKEQVTKDNAEEVE